jgi:transcriptional regulator with XRE-family HTH domain
MNKVNTMIKLLRTEKGMNQEQLAEQLHVTRQAISSWETGKTQPDIDTLTRIAELFDVSVEQLIYGKTYDKAHPEKFKVMFFS